MRFIRSTISSKLSPPRVPPADSERISTISKKVSWWMNSLTVVPIMVKLLSIETGRLIRLLPSKREGRRVLIWRAILITTLKIST